MAVVVGLSGEGRRVALRRRVRDADGPAAGDVVGRLMRDSETVEVLPDDAPACVVDRCDVLAMRDVPPQAVRPTSSPERLIRFFAGQWPGLETARLGGWVLRAGGGFTRRANSTLVVGDPGCPEDEALEIVTRWYADRGLPALLRVLGPPVATPGWSVLDEVREVDVLVADLRRMSRPDVLLPARVADLPSEEWLALWRGGAGRDEPARSVLTAVRARYVTLHDPASPDGPAIGCGRLVVDRRWAHVSAVEVASTHRGRGLGRALMGAIITEAVTNPTDGPTSFVGLEVEGDNVPATRLYASLGFHLHHRYHYRRRNGPKRGAM